MANYRVGISSDFLKADGCASLPEFDLSPMARDPDVEMAYVDAVDGAFTPEGLDGLDALVLMRPRVGRASFPDAGRLALVARCGVGYDSVNTHACTDACASYNPAPGCKGRKGTPSNVCDQNGCGMNPFRYGPGTTYNNENNNLDWYGPGPGKTLDSTQPFTVVTQFHESATKGLDNITRFYFQKGKRVDLPTLYVVKPRGGGQRMGPFAIPALTEPVRTCTF